MAWVSTYHAIDPMWNGKGALQDIGIWRYQTQFESAVILRRCQEADEAVPDNRLVDTAGLSSSKCLESSAAACVFELSPARMQTGFQQAT